MLRRARIIEKIRRGEIERVGKSAMVDFDEVQWAPLGFSLGGQYHEVLELLACGAFANWDSVDKGMIPDVYATPPQVGGESYLVQTDRGIYGLVRVRGENLSNGDPANGDPADDCNPTSTPDGSSYGWVVDFRVLDSDTSEEELLERHDDPSVGERLCLAIPFGVGSILVGGDLLGAGLFHGHVCPELVVGFRAAKLAQRELGFERRNAHQRLIVAENSSAAVDALQYITGCTVGKKSLIVEDVAKHIYHFKCPEGTLDLSLRLDILAQMEMLTREMDAMKNASEAEITRYRAAIDRLICTVLDMPEDELFSIRVEKDKREGGIHPS